MQEGLWKALRCRELRLPILSIRVRSIYVTMIEAWCWVLKSKEVELKARWIQCSCAFLLARQFFFFSSILVFSYLSGLIIGLVLSCI